MQYGFPKNERLKSKIAFEKLFTEGSGVRFYPLRMVLTPWSNDSANGIQAGFSVSKRRFKHAVDRNLVKRQMRETYRIARVELPESKLQLAVLFIYVHHQKSTFSEIEVAMKKCLAHLAKLRQPHTAN